jgi:hypothetical protein
MTNAGNDRGCKCSVEAVCQDAVVHGRVQAIRCKMLVLLKEVLEL